MKRWETRVLDEVRTRFDNAALGGRAIGRAGVDPRVFDSNPSNHSTVGASLLERHAELSKLARAGKRLPANIPLISRWTLTYDIYSPKLRRFIEVDERQHFSRARLARIKKSRPSYPSYFWEHAFQRLLRFPAVDRDPPHRDEARAYRD